MIEYKNFGVLLLLLVSLIILVNTLFTVGPIQIISETGERITSTGASYFNLSAAIILVIFSLALGMAIVYLYKEMSVDEMAGVFYKKDEQKKIKNDKLEIAMNMLSGDDKKVFGEIMKYEKGIRQNELCAKSGFSKVKITRAVARLEAKGLIHKSRHGLTNLIVIKEI